MKSLKNWFYTITLVGLMSVMVACGADGESDKSSNASAESSDGEKVFKLTHITDESHMWHQAAVEFKDELEERSDGRLSVDIYANGQLGTEADMLQQIESGSIDFGFITAAEMSTREEAFSAWFAPYLFETEKEADKASESQGAMDILNTLENSDLIGLDYIFGSGQRIMLFVDEKVTGPKDMAGHTLRVAPSPPMLHFYNSAGASTEGLPLTEVYSAAQQGVIDGMDFDLDTTIKSSFYEVVNYAAITNHMVWPAVVIGNEQTFEGLSEEDQQIVRDSLIAATEFSVETRTAQEEELIKELENQGVEVYDLGQDAFEEQIEEFDKEFSPKDPLIEKFINTYR